VALVIVLWAISLISAAMIGLAGLLQRQLGQEVAALQNARALLVAESGIQMALNPGIFPADMEAASRELSGRLEEGWRGPRGGVEVKFEVKKYAGAAAEAGMTGEEGKMNLNALLLGDRNEARRILTNLFASWEVNATTSSTVIDALLDWVDPDDLTTGTDEVTEDYERIGKSGPRNGPFLKIEEVEQVRGWPELAKEAREGPRGVDWKKKLTIFGNGQLSLMTAEEDVIEAWLDLRPGAAAGFVEARRGPDQIPGTQDDVVNLALLPGAGTATNRITPGWGDLWRVTSTGSVGGVKRTLVALISRNPPMVRSRWLAETEEER
jgi:hypothetical protein